MLSAGGQRQYERQTVRRRLPRFRIPDSDCRVHTPADYPDSIESDRIDLMEVATEYVNALAGLNVPKATCRVIASARDFIATYVQTPYALFVSFQNTQQSTPLDVPNSQRAISRTSDGDRPIVQYF